MTDSEKKSDVIAKRILFEGRVTGVGFRFFAQRVVSGVDNLQGYVRNVSSNQVECVVQGRPEKVERAVLELQKGPPTAHIDKCHVTDIPVDTKRGPFSIVP